jgi:phage-related protein
VSIIDDVWNWVLEQINRVIGIVNNIQVTCFGLFNNLVSWVNDIYDYVMREIRGLWAWIEYLKGQIASIINNAVEVAIGYARAAVTQVIGVIQNQITAIYKSIGGFYDWTLKQIHNLQGYLLNKIQEYFDYLDERVTAVEEKVGQGFDVSGIQNKILDWVFGAIVKAWR